MSTLSNETYVFQSEFYTDRIKAARAEAQAKALLRVLAARGFVVTAALREQIMTCDDSGRLEHALDVASTAEPGQAFTF
jgi:acetolactate synthase regulatory subunit